MLFLIGYGLSISLLPAFFIAIMHLHIGDGFSFHLHSPSESIFHLGMLNIDIITLILANIVLLVLYSALEINQLAMWKAYSDFKRHSRPEVARDIITQYDLLKMTKIEVLVVENPRPEAYTFTLLKRKFIFLPFHSLNVLAISTGLINLLTREELETVVAHEISHIRSLDTIFLPLLRTLSSLLFFDFILRLIRNRIVNSREFYADESAAYATGRPLDLARSLFKIYESFRSAPVKGNPVPLLEGHPIPLLVRRINRLIELSKIIPANANLNKAVPTLDGKSKMNSDFGGNLEKIIDRRAEYS